MNIDHTSEPESTDAEKTETDPSFWGSLTESVGWFVAGVFGALTS